MNHKESLRRYGSRPPGSLRLPSGRPGRSLTHNIDAKLAEVAETAARIGLGLGVSSGIRAENVAYLKAWLRELREKPVFIFSVLSDVQQVVRFFEEELCMRLFDTAPAENGA